MGKPSSYKFSKKSDQSINSNTSHHRIQTPMSTQKMETVKRNKHNKTRNKIRNLFRKLKRQSESSFNTSQDATVICCDNNNEQIENNVINKNVPVSTGQKRKLSSTSLESTKRRKSDSSILIEDDISSNNVQTSQPASPIRHKTDINCSTPINRRDSKTIQNLIINNFTEPIQNGSPQSVNEEIINLTKEINQESYLTIDLTADTEVNRTNNTIIDVDKTLDYTTQTADCTVISVSNASLSMSGDSEVTVLQNKGKMSKTEKAANTFAKGISKLNDKEKGKLLEILTQNIFNGCKISHDIKSSLTRIKASQSQATETVEDTFIKEVILGETKSRNSIGSNIYHPSKDVKNRKGLRMVVIDGSNVAMEHTKGNMFSVKGLKICIDYFVRRGHVVKAFVPRFRCKYGKSSDPKLLDQLERQGLVVYTPSREIQGRICVSYDDRYIVQCAAEFDGVIVSGDNYRDLLQENPRWRFVIENRLLPFTWVEDMIMFPKDPLGRNGPTLEEFLRHPSSPTPAVVHIL